MLAHNIFPSQGNIFVPSHLRILHVAREAQLLERSLLENLTLGLLVPGKPEPRDVERVIEILEAVGLKNLRRQVEREAAGRGLFEPAEAWMKALTASEVNLIGLARAFIMNPEVMVLHKPLVAFQEETAKKVAGLLHEHVANRGLKVDLETLARRRPRTVIMSVQNAAASFAEVVWRTTPEKGGQTRMLLSH